MPHVFDDSPKTYSFSWFKEKFVESLVGVVCMGVVGLIGFAFVQAYLGDYKFEKMKSEFRSEMRKMKNDAVEREADIMKAIQEIKDKQADAPQIPPPPALGSPNVQQHSDSAKLNWLEQHREKD